MKYSLISAVCCAAAIGGFCGWSAGAGQPPGQNPQTSLRELSGAVKTSAPARGSIGVSFESSTLRDWDRLIESAPLNIRSEDTAHMARMRTLARGLSTADLTERVEAGLADPGQRESVSLPLSALIRELARRNAGQVCALLEREKGWRYDPTLFQEWGRQDRKAALAWLEAHPEHAGRRYEIIQGWAETEPASAFNALAEMSRKDTLEAADSGEERWNFFNAWALKDPEAAVAAWSTGPDLNFCINARWGNALSECDPAQRERLLNAILKVTEPGLRASALSECAGYFAYSDEPRRAIPLTEDPLVPEAERDRMRQQVLEVWVQNGGPETADWFLRSSPPGQTTAAVKRIMAAWNMIGDPEASLAWLQQLQEADMPEEAGQIFAETAFRSSPVTALRGWRALRSGAEHEEESAATLGELLSTAPSASRLPEFLKEAGFPEELGRRVLKAAGQ